MRCIARHSFGRKLRYASFALHSLVVRRERIRIDMSDDAVIIIVVIAIALIVLVWLSYLAAGIVLAFTAFVMDLPLIVTVLMFILFPPTLIVFLVGLAFIYFGIIDRLAGSNSD